MTLDQHEPVELRKSYSERLGSAIAFQRMSDEEKMKFVKQQLNEQEENNEVSKMYKLQKKAVYERKGN